MLETEAVMEVLEEGLARIPYFGSKALWLPGHEALDGYSKCPKAQMVTESISYYGMSVVLILIDGPLGISLNNVCSPWVIFLSAWRTAEVLKAHRMQ